MHDSPSTARNVRQRLHNISDDLFKALRHSQISTVRIAAGDNLSANHKISNKLTTISLSFQLPILPWSDHFSTKTNTCFINEQRAFFFIYIKKLTKLFLSLEKTIRTECRELN